MAMESADANPCVDEFQKCQHMYVTIAAQADCLIADSVCKASNIPLRGRCVILALDSDGLFVGRTKLGDIIHLNSRRSTVERVHHYSKPSLIWLQLIRIEI
jgi:hypothetical protein